VADATVTGVTAQSLDAIELGHTGTVSVATCDEMHLKAGL
jgi:hypothetical protein